MESVGVAKIVSIVVLAVVSIVCGMIPVLISKKMNWKSETAMSNTSKSWLSGLLCFGGGVLMATSLIHLLPEVHEGFGALKESGEMETSLPIGEIIICAGFFLVYLIEETVHFFADRHVHSQVDVAIHRSVGVRECSVSLEGHPTPPCGSDEAECAKDSICKLECQVREFCRDVEAANEDKRPSYDSGEQLVNKVPEKIVKESKSTEKKKPTSHEGHHHHHGLVAGDGHSILPAIRGLLVVIGLSIHEVFEGLALGLESTEGDVWQLLAAIGAHKFVIAFCVGLDMTVNGVRLCLHVTYILVFGLITSLGIGIAMALTSGDQQVSENSIPVLVLQALAAGTLIYVSFFEIMERERLKGNNRLMQWLLIVLGFLAILGLEALMGHEHDHDHDHDHETPVSETASMASIFRSP